MSFQTFVTEQLAAITETLNGMITNAKKIDELPEQTMLNPLSKIHVSKSGNSESVQISQIIEAAKNNIGNQLLYVGEITVEDNEIIIPAGASWIINDVTYETISETRIPVSYTSEGLVRLDNIIANNLGTIVLQEGTETAGIAVPPINPINTVVVTQILVSDSTIGDPEPPVIGSGYLEKDGYGGTATTLNDAIALEAQNRANADDAINAEIIYIESQLELLSENKADLISGKVPVSQLPSYVDDVLEGYLLSNVFYVESSHTTVIPAEVGKIYLDLTTGQSNKQYRYSGSTYIQITNGLIASTNDVPEGGSNLYFTTARVLAAVLTGISFVTGGAIVSTDSVLVAFGKIQKQINDLSGIYQVILVSGTNIKTINGNSILGSGDISTGSGDMTTNTAQTVSGLKTFLINTFGMRNIANTATSFFTNSNTASRTYTLPDKNGTVAMTSDLPTNTIVTGTQNFIPKYNNSGGTQIGNSRLKDDGTFFGLGSVSPIALSKDIQLGRNSDKEIGIEQSDNSTVGRDLTISAGRTINFVESTNFLLLSSGVPVASYGMASSPSGNIYIANGTNVYKQTGGAGTFVNLAVTNRDYRAIAVSPINNVYVAVNNGDIYMQTNETGALTALGQTSRAWSGMASAPNGDVYACVSGGDIYKQTGGTGNFVALGQTSRAWSRMASAPNGDIFALDGINIYKQTGGTGNFSVYIAGAYTGITISPNNDLYVATNTIYVQVNSSGALNLVTTIGAASIWGMASLPNGNVYGGDYSGNVYVQNNSGVGLPNLNGGTLKLKAGTGKAGGESRIHFITGQKTVSGTNMQLETLRGYIDENGFFVFVFPTYANDAAADADSNLPSGASYKVTGNRTLFQKP